MTIDELIKEMEEEYDIFLKGTGLDDQQQMEKERKNNPECDIVCTANEMTLDILRKYKKIKEIVQSKTDRVSYDIGFRQIKKVVEDKENS
jgi:hypothetical protein